MNFNNNKNKTSEDTREFNVQADDPSGLSCLVLDRQTFTQFFNDASSNLKHQESLKMYKRSQTQLFGLLSRSDDDEPDFSGVRLSE